MLLSELPLYPKGSPSSNSYRIRKTRARCHCRRLSIRQSISHFRLGQYRAGQALGQAPKLDERELKARSMS